jgi:hypothetical protein
MQTQSTQQILQLINLCSVAQNVVLWETLPKINIEQTTQEEANLYLTLYFFSNAMSFDALFSQEVAQKLRTLRKDIAQYLDILTRIAQGLVDEAEMENYLMKKMHQLSWAKTNLANNET